MQQRLRPLLVMLALLVAFGVGFVAGQHPTPAIAGTLQQGEDSDSKLARLETIWELVHQEYYEQPIDDEALVQGAINGMLETLDDRHTSYMPPGEFEMLNESFDGSYSGIGALVEAEDGKLLIVSPFDDSPAQEAGLQPGDEIIKVNDTLVSTFEDPLAAITLVRGPAGEAVALRLRRGSEVFDVTIVRATIPLISASGEMREDGIGYVRVSEFGDKTSIQLRETLTKLMAENPKGLILDLRGNPGGGLFAAIEVASEFIGDGTVMIEESGDGESETFTAQPGGLATDPELPLVVLVDAGSASASEIVAGAIQDRGRGQLLGEITYGKGTVQNWRDLGSENGGVRITIARWLTPNGSWVHEKGLIPDILIEAEPTDSEDAPDIQLESAANLLLGIPLPTATPRGSSPWKCCPQN
ncbi:MAG: S41 family peptidase [Ardenticatenales bacterium]|nr:S41 family peptidase [Ardenticatenales bacterium]